MGRWMPAEKYGEDEDEHRTLISVKRIVRVRYRPGRSLTPPARLQCGPSQIFRPHEGSQDFPVGMIIPLDEGGEDHFFFKESRLW